MAKVNWGTTASVIGGLAPTVAGKIKNALKKQPTGSDSGSSGAATEGDAAANPGSFKRGGKVRKTGMARVHKGERVLTKKQNKKYMSGKR
jgi:hypothetical protein